MLDHVIEVRLGGLQSEGCVERSSFERQDALRIPDVSAFACRSAHLMSRKRHSVLGVGASRQAWAGFSNEAVNVHSRDTAAVITLHDRRGRQVVVIASHRRRITRLTPELAEQRPLRRDECQDDRKDSYSKHGTLVVRNGKNRASGRPHRSVVFAAI